MSVFLERNFRLELAKANKRALLFESGTAIDARTDMPNAINYGHLRNEWWGRQTVVGRAFRRGERLSALVAPVSTAFPGPRSVESVVNNASGTDFAPQRTCAIETSAILHFGSALTMRELCLQNSGSNSSTQTG